MYVYVYRVRSLTVRRYSLYSTTEYKNVLRYLRSILLRDFIYIYISTRSTHFLCYFILFLSYFLLFNEYLRVLRCSSIIDDDSSQNFLASTNVCFLSLKYLLLENTNCFLFLFFFFPPLRKDLGFGQCTLHPCYHDFHSRSE